VVEAKARTGALIGMPDGAGDNSAKNARVKGEVGSSRSVRGKNVVNEREGGEASADRGGK